MDIDCNCVFSFFSRDMCRVLNNCRMFLDNMDKNSLGYYDDCVFSSLST